MSTPSPESPSPESPGPELAAQWQQPPRPVVADSQLLPPGTYVEPPMWAQPTDAGAPAAVGIPAPAAPVRARPGTRVVNAVFGRSPTVGKAIFSLVWWMVGIAYFLVRGMPSWVFAAAIVGMGASLTNVVRWYLGRR